MRNLKLLVVLFPLLVLGQEAMLVQKADNYIYDGNQAFDASNNVEAERNYRRAAATGQKKDIAQYNIGTTLQQDNYVEEAIGAYVEAIKTTTERPSKHRTFHNVGNALMQVKDYKGAVEAYKNALRNNPNDDETRYNYALAKKMLEDEKNNEDQQDDQDNQDNQDQQNDQNKDQDGDKDKDQEGDNEQDNKDPSDDDGEKEQDKKDTDESDPKDQDGDKEKEEQQQQANPTQLSPQQVKNLLEAMSNEEKKVQDKVNAQKAKASGVKSKKDW